MNVGILSADPLAVETDLLCYMVAEESAGVPGIGAEHALAPAVRQSLGDLRGRFAKIVSVANPGGSPSRILIAGLGTTSKITADTIRHTAGAISKRAQELGVARFAVVCPDVKGVDPGDAAAQITEGCSLALYDFDMYRSKKAEAEPDLTVVCGTDVADIVGPRRWGQGGKGRVRGGAVCPGYCQHAAQRVPAGEACGHGRGDGRREAYQMHRPLGRPAGRWGVRRHNGGGKGQRQPAPPHRTGVRRRGGPSGGRWWGRR